MLILGIETTCDETSASIVKENNGKLDILSNVVSSQIKIHAKWGGVVPNLAAREHLKNIIPVLSKAFSEAKINPKNIDLMACANGPGLIPALLVGVNASKTLSYSYKKPLLGIHHIEGHIYANFIDKKENPKFPAICLVVSGGHTQLVFMKNHFNYEIIGETLDDAAGEAFDKAARIMGLPYPGGPAVSKRALEARGKKLQFEIQLPRPMIGSKNFNFSFSGLKTAVLYETKKHPDLLKNESYIDELCLEFQNSVCDVLISKTISAAKKMKPKTVMLAGGVSANRELRKGLRASIIKELPETSFSVPEIKYCVDNAAMISAAAFYRWKNMDEKERKIIFENWKKMTAHAELKMK